MSVVDEAAGWADELMDAEWRGRRDNESSVRFRLARKIGVPESYLFRLQYKRREMRDVRGSVYRSLLLGRRMYGLTCELIEKAADQVDQAAGNIEVRNAARQGHSSAGEGNRSLD